LHPPTAVPRDYAEAECYVRADGVGGAVGGQREARPGVGGGRAQRRGAAAGAWLFPYTLGVPIAEEALEELRPVLVPLQQTEPGHELEPLERRGDVAVDGIPMREEVAQHQVRLRDDFF